ncbi:MAG: ABC transporter permease [Gammaproteobacteria bacterium]|nr:ABC transporter permease [Gammaproteobacteria bacterium]MCW9030243.1 ABC transporter permease [Gammaproteobacteria bacterium]
MFNILKLAAKNLMRYRRRTILTSLLITIGIVAVLMFIALSGSFRALMIGQITDSVLGHIQVHKKGYVASIDSLPLTLNMNQKMASKVTEFLDADENIEAWSNRIKFGAMFSNFTETTSIRLNAVDPEKEVATCPLLSGRIIEGQKEGALIEPGKILIPELIAKGLKIKVGDAIVLVATNKDGSVNGNTFVVKGVLEGISGPGGRDGYMHINDARSLLRMSDDEVSEVAIRLKNPEKMQQTFKQMDKYFSEFLNQKGKPVFEVHTWDKLSPFSNIAKMIDMLDVFIKVMLVSIVLISIMNVMLMAVYERIREIGTIAAIGTVPSRILSLFIAEGLLLGILGTVIGTLVSLTTIYIMNKITITFSFGRQENLLLEPSISVMEVLVICSVVILVSVLASLQPAWKASRMDPITALRHF